MLEDKDYFFSFKNKFKRRTDLEGIYGNVFLTIELCNLYKIRVIWSRKKKIQVKMQKYKF